MTLAPTLALAQQHFVADRRGEAEQLARQIVEAQPGQPDALYLLGVLALVNGQPSVAAEHLQAAVISRPGDARLHHAWGEAVRVQGQADQAVVHYQQALACDPAHADAWYGLGLIYLDQARLDEAIAAFGQAVQHRPDDFNAQFNLANVLRTRGRMAEAAEWYRRVLKLQPFMPGPLVNLGITLQLSGDVPGAIECYRLAIQHHPQVIEAHSALGAALTDEGQLDAAAECLQNAMRLRPDFPGLYINVGNIYKEQGAVDQCVAAYRRALQLDPHDAVGHSNLLYAIHYSTQFTPPMILEEHRRWAQLHAEPLTKLRQPHSNDRTPERRLRVGYVSPDLNGHAVGRFMLPLLQAHDRRNFEIYCYAALPFADSFTQQCQAACDAWRDVKGFSNELLVEQIRNDRIDVLVDLSLHSAGNRLQVFACKPAPVQVTYLAYCSTTGLSAIDYRLTDPYLDPPGQGDEFYTERSVRLPTTYWCYRPLPDTPPVGPLPALTAGQVTFGCLNNFCKVTSITLELWARLLSLVPNSRLLLYMRGGSQHDRLRDFFAQRGIAPQRLALTGRVPPVDYFGFYQRQIDIALDPFPYGGGTTTCDALWMGVPVVSLSGATAVSRAGMSLLSNVGLPELVARDSQQYLRIAAWLAQDLPRLAALRASLRSRMQSSPLTDAARFARDVEHAYRTMWRAWCGEKC